MRINRVSKTTSASSKKVTNKPDMKNKISFKEILDYGEDEHRQRQLFDEMLEEIKEKGQNLVENRTVESLLEYKQMVKGFVEEAVEFGLKVEERRGFSRKSRSEVLRVVKRVDNQLLELTDIILSQEQSKIRLLKKVGEIEGLLVNIYL